MPPNDRRYLVLLSHVSLARPATNGANPFACCSKIPTIITDRSLSVLSALDICDLQDKLTKFFANVYYDIYMKIIYHHDMIFPHYV